MRRGDVYRFEPVIARPGKSTTRLIVTGDALNANTQIPTLYVMNVVAEDPGFLLAVRIDDFGWALPIEVDRPLRRQLVEYLGRASDEEMEQVDNAIRATFDV